MDDDQPKQFQVELPFNGLILAATDPQMKAMTFQIGSRKDFRAVIKHFFRVLPFVWLRLGIVDPGDGKFIPARNGRGYLGVLRNEDITDEALDQAWVALRSVFEGEARRRPDFPKLCKKFIHSFAIIQLKKELDDQALLN